MYFYQYRESIVFVYSYICVWFTLCMIYICYVCLWYKGKTGEEAVEELMFYCPYNHPVY